MLRTNETMSYELPTNATYDAAREIRAAGGPMFVAPGLSRLWAAAESDGSRVLTWENLFVGNDTNTPVSAQIRLCANGDFTTCSNAVVTICRRLHPSDWDGDGIPNLKDANPTICDGDFFGSQGEMPTNANPSAYCTVDIVVSSHVAEVVFSGDSPSNLPDPHFMARAGETNSVTILKGKTYLGGAFHWSSNSCCLVTGSGCVFSYSCDGTCNCGGCQAGGAGMKLELFVQPETVSFSGIVMEEVPSSTGIHQGYFSNVFFTEEWCHTTEFGAGVWRNIRPDNYCGDDNATRGDELPREMPDGTMVFDLNAGTWSDGLMSWDIPWGWAERGCPDNGVPVKTLATQYNQVFQFSADGTLSVAKFGNVVSRGTNNVFRLNGVVVNGHPYLEVYSAIEGE